MTSLYDVQENHYKKMLDLQEKLRKSEEERIRLEERFNLLVQESRNRHQACINKLRIRYVEFLEEQRTRDERNNKLLGALEKVDKSLSVMTAKTERLNILRKQYEAYLLRTYGNLRASGSLTADSGLESQNDQEISPSCMLSKAVQTMSLQPNSFPYENEAFARSTYKAADERLRKSNSLEKATPDVQSSWNLKSGPSSLAPFAYEDTNNAFTTNLWKPPILSKTERLSDINVKKTNPYPDHLDQYLEKIKGLYVKVPEKNEHENEHSFEEVDHEQNTSGDLLNMTLSEDGFESSAEEEAKKQRSRIRGAREAYASQLLERKSAVDEENTRENKFSTPTTNLYPQTKPLAGSSEDGLKLFSEDDLQQPFENALAKLANLSKSRRVAEKMIVESDRVPFIKKEELREEEKEQDEEAEAHVNVNLDDQISDQEFKDDGDGIIEDDYDHTVDIDTWMPDDFDQQPEEVAPPNAIRDIPRRKLESIEEVEQAEDEENEVDADVSPIVAEANEQRNFQSSSLDAENFKQLSQEINNEQQGNGSNSNYLEQYEQQQPYQDDPNQRYPYDSNIERNKQDAYGDYKNDQQQRYQQYNPNDEEHPQAQYDAGNEYNAYVDVNEEQNRIEEHSNASSTGLNDSLSYTQEVRISEGNAKEQSPDPRKKSSTESIKDVKDTSKDVKRKKDVIKSILDSDSESFIERNLSNTDSDFDFN